MDIVSGLPLDHIGYAVADIEKYLEEFFIPVFRPQTIGLIVEDPIQRVRVAFVTLKGGARIELIQPVDESSPVSKILKNRRGGLYHLCYLVEQLEQEIERFRGKRCLLISGPTPAAAFGRRRIAFLYTPQFDIIELVEAGADKEK
jgi:methylmalonyl-CoA/ethylmalonyl-CoA epimerase